MIALDTNVLVQFLTQDDPIQAAAAARLIARLTPEAPGFVAREVVVETVWVLERAYKYTRAEIAAALIGLLEARELRIEADARVGLAIDRYGKGGPGFSDQMIRAAAGEAGCKALASFDRQVAALEGGFVPQ